ncbi:dihydrolipoamide acetyltransferase family protein [Vagococcus intermedius]|uniref:Dihydrolipoamide acetyltransferase component of pyruvate dehydrogenase complex n=1 Tax=Vagococcus intermedius TaxID=2991418 RepID=A0AAF0I8A6_9ENTE|nr:dihydrolipoamide acetyltransferase family protein [Vagococcus intermedius]WEG73741.1 2-oxo acid dehydrogenase subunit E2 [Vagococcus intermedius]WEG75826.1 2-oxo acid dehydrogenase subunit E2 [Vagococcus intermedius]
MTLENITMPKLGESVTEGSISSWLVKPGQKVEKYEAIAEVLTDKVVAEIPSSFTGVIKEIIAEEDEAIEVGGLICTIETEGGGGSTETKEEPKTESAPPKPEKPAKAPVAKQATGAPRYSPAVLRMAGEHGLDLEQITGTGSGGRITRKDVLAYIEEGAPVTKAETAPVVEATHNVQASASPAEQPKASVPAAGSNDVEIPVSGVRKAIAKHMVESKHEIPHAWMMNEVDATNLVNYRDSIKENFKKEEGFNLTYFAFFVKAVAQALKKYPLLNSTWADDKIIQHKDINISIAIAANDVLFVPVIKNADEKSIKGIAREISELAGKAKAGKLSPADMAGGTFTVNSTGSFGSVQSMGIINHPQAGILQVEAIVKRPVVLDSMIAVRDMVNLCLSIDHRVLDGYMAGSFLKEVKANVEKITKDNTSIY